MGEFQSLLEKGTQGLSVADRTDLGIAFLEMGLFDIAIRQFKLIAEDNLSALCLLALAQIRSGSAFEATLSLQPVISDADIPAQDKKEIYYLMGCAYEQMGQTAKAKECFRFVNKIQPGYRDVKDRIDK